MPQHYYHYYHSGLSVPINSPFCPILQENGQYQLTEGFVFHYKNFLSGFKKIEKLEIDYMDQLFGEVDSDGEIMGDTLVFIRINISFEEGEEEGEEEEGDTEIISAALEYRPAEDEPEELYEGEYIIPVCLISNVGITRYLHENIHWQKMPSGERGDILMHDGFGWVRLAKPEDATPEDPFCLKHNGDMPFWEECNYYEDW